MIEKIEDSGELLALVIREGYEEEGLNFFTPEKTSFQLGHHNVKKGKRYRAHKTLPFENIENLIPSKIYLVKEGKAGVDVYNKNNEKVDYITLNKGDLILFVEGGHGLDILEDSKIIEIKQGPYRGTEQDKTFLE